MKKNRLFFSASLALLASMMVACGGGGAKSESKVENGEQQNAEKTDSEYSGMKIVLILPGSVDDQSWNASNNAGAKQCDKELGTKIEVVESVPVEEFEQTFTEYGEKGYDLVMAAGSQFDEACAAVAPQYEKTVYTIINGTKSDSDNMVPVFPKEYEGSYIAGVIAGYTTENGNFATMGGESNLAMVHLLDTYEGIAVATAKERGLADAKANRSFLNTWTDVSIGKAMASQMIDNGADTVFCYSNEATSGAIQATAEKKAKFVGFAANKNEESDCVVASVSMNWANVYPWIIKGIKSGELKGAQEVGVKEGVFETIFTDQCSEECKKAVEKATEEITNGKIDFKQYFSE